jgi:hypothetical protein
MQEMEMQGHRLREHPKTGALCLGVTDKQLARSIKLHVR